MEELEERTNNFNPAFAMSITDARQTQIAIAESIKMGRL
jgi:hypothetical protein